MPLSRLRLRLAAWFAVAFVVALTTLNLALYAYLRYESNHRLTRSLYDDARELADFIHLEYQEHPPEGLAAAAREALVEWPARPATFVVYGTHGERLAARGDTSQVQRMPVVLNMADTAVADVPSAGRYPFRQVTVAAETAPHFFIRASSSTQSIGEESQALAIWLVIAVPIVLALSLTGGYVLSRRALTPIEQLERAAAAIVPETLNQRLPVGRAFDEIDQLATQFNGLLQRLQNAQQQNRRFVQQAAHQIRTPLTLVLGEADLSLDRPRTQSEQRQTLERIRTAATQMKRRVDELLLLAQAEAGERTALDAAVELDGLALECADLMRARARQLGQRLELRRVEAVAVRGNEPLLKEAVLELLDNACRHGSNEGAIGISAYADGTTACLCIASFGEPSQHATRIAPDAASTTSNGRQGLGLTIVRWIASEHGGSLAYEHEAGFNLYRLQLPALMAGELRT